MVGYSLRFLLNSMVQPIQIEVNLRALLQQSNSKAMCETVVKWVGSSPARFAQLLSFINDKDKMLSQRAAYPMSYAIENNPAFIIPHYDILIKRMKEPGLHDAIRRNIIRALQYVDIPEKWQGVVMDSCFQFLTDPGEKPAVKASCITVLGRMAKQFPEIIPEIKVILEERWDLETAAFRARARKVFSF